MNSQNIHIDTLENGLTLMVERMTHVQSAAFSLMVPSGSIYDPVGQNSSASVLCDLLIRGAGERDSKQLSAALDNLGVQRHESVSSKHITFTGAVLADNLAAALEMYGDIVLKPHLPAEQFEASRAVAEQSLRAMEDEPRQKVMVELRRRCYDLPWGLPTEGSLEELAALTADSVRSHYDRCFRPDETILGIAGNVDPESMLEVVSDIFSGWKRKQARDYETGPGGRQNAGWTSRRSGGPRRDHIQHESAQTHIGIAYESVPYRHPDYYAAWAAVSVLSGGMSSRLFTEVREKRGLCYAVYATLNSLKDEARVLCYAGTTSEQAQETLTVTLRELERLSDGMTADELDRVKARAKSSLIMQQESTLARSSSIVRDWYHLGRVTTLEETRSKVEALTVDSVLDYVHERPARDFVILTIGPQPLEETSAVS